MLEIHKDIERDEQRGRKFNLEPDELAFYDAIAVASGTVYDEPFLRNLVHDVVLKIKKNLKVDWTKEHRDQEKAEVRAAVKSVLRKQVRDGKLAEGDVEKFLDQILKQAEALYADWPLAA